VYEPSDLAVNDPVTVSEPEIDTLVQERGSSPASEMSRLLSLNVTHDELTFQVPTTLPPQAVTLGQDAPPPVPLELPPVLVELPPVPVFPPVLELPPVPDEPIELELQAPKIIAIASVVAGNAD